MDSFFTDCGNESDCWLEEFRKWCDEFQTYSENIQQWRCMKVCREI